MNELQQVLLIFAVVVIAGLYFLSRSRQGESKKNAAVKETSQPTPGNREASSVEHHIDAKTPLDTPVASEHKKASDALNELGEAHIPVSETTEKRISKEIDDSADSDKLPNKVEGEGQSRIKSETISSNDEPLVPPNQGTLFFGDEFDIAETKPQEESVLADEPEINTEAATETAEQKNQGKHHVLVVDDPGMTGELDDEHYPSDHIKPSFGIPEETQKAEAVSVSYKEPEVFVIMVMSSGQEFAMTEVNQALYGVGLTLSEQSIFVKKDNMGNAFIKVANLLEPGTFPAENLESYSTPGVAMILELPTTVRAPAAMHELIMMARKISQRLKGRLYNMERHLIKESDLQSMRDAALDYESQPL